MRACGNRSADEERRAHVDAQLKRTEHVAVDAGQSRGDGSPVVVGAVRAGIRGRCRFAPATGVPPGAGMGPGAWISDFFGWGGMCV
jgi:hypothetical protein